MDISKTKAVIGEGAHFSGTISNAKSIEINGTVEADLEAEKVSIGPEGEFRGAIKSDLVVISGHYHGEMHAHSVWATETAQIAGEVHYQSLQMDRGAALNCRVVHNWTEDTGNSVAEPEDEDAASDDAETGDEAS
ncbi:bactofilin family protein [Candidatus Puniceispirillum marinum]|uniref:Integral membrane protein CcmA involved in cell shape determination n=1 Tax=Puniceispirillum marinum (strain IMCC1322) TaxID=488538 RepID=D5BRZ8_PUNMI|nr:polymer-forming cytoskeletal protein [Candidatus Puniceispirillum marinum]ADE39045.1 Integral membrane protein CcmA involved in cell shape determination [Candidatus Puniceispirillum marinum IMCC1322]